MVVVGGGYSLSVCQMIKTVFRTVEYSLSSKVSQVNLVFI